MINANAHCAGWIPLNWTEYNSTWIAILPTKKTEEHQILLVVSKNDNLVQN